MIAKHLQKGDTIGLVAPSGPHHKNKKFEIENFISYIEEQGYKIKLSKNFFAHDKYGACAGTPQQRADDINEMFADDEVAAIWCLQGGHPANQVLNLLDYELIKKNPKIFLGKSDIDVLLLAINKKTDLITFHTCDTKIGSDKEMDFPYTKKWFEKRLVEKSSEVEPSEEWKCVVPGTAEGRVVGCNMTSMLKLAGTEYFPDFSNSILFLESLKSEPRIIIARLTQLKQLGVFEGVKGVVVGNIHEFQGEFLAEDVIADVLEDLHIPILKINEFGHYQPHMFLPIGAQVRMDAEKKTLEFTSDFLE